MFLVVVWDAGRHRNIGRAMGNIHGAQWVIDAMTMTVARRKPGTVSRRNNQGPQELTVAFGLHCQSRHVRVK